MEEATAVAAAPDNSENHAPTEDPIAAPSSSSSPEHAVGDTAGVTEAPSSSTAPDAAAGDTDHAEGQCADTAAAGEAVQSDAQHVDPLSSQASVQEGAAADASAQHVEQEAAAQHMQPTAQPAAGLTDVEAAAHPDGGPAAAKAVEDSIAAGKQQAEAETEAQASVEAEAEVGAGAEAEAAANAGETQDILASAAQPAAAEARAEEPAAVVEQDATAAAAADAAAEAEQADCAEQPQQAAELEPAQVAEPAAAAAEAEQADRAGQPEQAAELESAQVAEPEAAQHSMEAAAAEEAHADEPAAVAEQAEPEAAQHSMEAADTAAAADVQTRQPDKAFFVDGVRAIDVEVNCGPGLPCKLLRVLMDVSGVQASTKPYLGGFRHKQTGTTFHHASMQTPADQAAGQKRACGQHAGTAAAAGVCCDMQQQQSGACWHGQKLSRETQTVKASACSSQTVREASTQMAAPGLLLDCSGDRVLTPRPYVSSEVVQQRQEAAARTIQRFARGLAARRRAAVLRSIKQERDAFLAETAAEAAQSAQEHRRREVERRTHPLSAADFALLESELDSWRQQQAAAIKAAGLDKQEEQAALQLLLAKETRLLHTLDRLRTTAHQQRKASGRQQTLGRLAQPKTWALSNGKKVLVHTPLTVRAAELQQLYRGVTLSSLSTDERLDVLLHIKWVVREWDSAVTRELLELIEREADLLNRGRSPKTLDGLRKRIAGLFLTCCQNPAFNPEAAALRVNAVGAQGPEAYEYDLVEQRAAA